MARMEVNGFELADERLSRIADRALTRRIVAAGVDACMAETRRRIEEKQHIKSHSMIDSIQPGVLHEDIDKTWQEVYPQGLDSRGVSNSTKAYVIDHGIGKRPYTKRSGVKTRNRTGDKFLTGKKNEMEEIVTKAMRAEGDRILREMGG